MSSKPSKSESQSILLRYHSYNNYFCKVDYDYNMIESETGLTKRQIYKWLWDERKRIEEAEDQSEEHRLWLVHQLKYEDFHTITQLNKNSGIAVLSSIFIKDAGLADRVMASGILESLNRIQLICAYKNN